MKLKRLIAGALSAAMLLSVSSTLAFADVTGNILDETENVADGTMTFNTVMTLGQDAITAPNINFTYTLTAGSDSDLGSITTTTTVTTVSDGSTSTKDVETELAVYAGVMSAVTGATDTDNDSSVDTATVTVNYSDLASDVWTTVKDNDDNVTSVYVSGTVSYTFDASILGTAGIYLYMLNESVDTYSGLYTEDNQTRYVYVSVVNGTDENGDETLVIDQILMTEGSLAGDYTKSEGYTSSYGIAPTDDEDDTDPDDPGTDSSKSQDFIVTDIAKGTMATQSKVFYFATVEASLGAEFKDMEFTVTGALDEGGNVLDDYTVKVVETEDSGTDAKTYSLSFNCYLSSSTYFTILGVIEGMEFTVTISDAANDGYSYYARVYDGETDPLDYTGADWTNLDTVDTDGDFTYGVHTVNSYTNTVDTDYTKNEGIDFATVKGSDDTPEDEDPYDDAPKADDDEQITYSGALPDTGVVLDLAPYAIMMVLAAGFITFRFARAARHTEE